MENVIIVLILVAAVGTHYRCAFGRKSFVRGLASPIVRTANQTRTLCVLKQWFSVLTLCASTHGFSTNAYSVMCTGGFLRYWQ